MKHKVTQVVQCRCCRGTGVKLITSDFADAKGRCTICKGTGMVEEGKQRGTEGKAS